MPLEILTEEDKQRVIEALRDLEVLGEEIERAERAGIDVSAQKERYQQLKEQLEGIHRVYIAPPRARTRR